MLSQTPEEYLFYAWWAFFPGNVALISSAWFGYHSLTWTQMAFCDLWFHANTVGCFTSHHDQRHQFPPDNRRWTKYYPGRNSFLSDSHT